MRMIALMVVLMVGSAAASEPAQLSTWFGHIVSGPRVGETIVEPGHFVRVRTRRRTLFPWIEKYSIEYKWVPDQRCDESPTPAGPVPVPEFVPEPLRVEDVSGD